MRRLIISGFAAAVVLATAQPSRADDLIKSLSQARVAELLKDAGYRAEIASGMPPFVRTGAGGYNVMVFLYECRDDECPAMRFYVGFRPNPKFTPAFADRFNAERRYAKAYLAANGGLNFVYDVDLRAGVSPGIVKQSIQQFEALLARFDDFIRNAPVPPTASPSGIVAGGVADKARGAEALAAEGKYIEAVAQLDEAAQALWEKSPLVFRRALWVASPPEGFGVYNPRESNVYASGAKMTAYVEPVGFGWRQMGDVYQTDLAIDIVIKDKSGKEMQRKDDFSGLKLGSRVRNREFMTTMSYTFGGIPKGEYVLDTIVHDKVSGKTGTFSLPFVVQ